MFKPAPWDETIATRKQIPANEHVTMQIARQVYGITTAENGLCFTKDGQMVYITKRFDILPDGTKAEMEDFAALIGRNEQSDGTYFKYSGCYEDIARCIRKYIPAWMVDMERFFELVVFNYIYANGDNHLKNFSVIRQGGDYRLAPAYDLLNTSLHVIGDDFGLVGSLLHTFHQRTARYRGTRHGIHPSTVGLDDLGNQFVEHDVADVGRLVLLQHLDVRDARVAERHAQTDVAVMPLRGHLVGASLKRQRRLLFAAADQDGGEHKIQHLFHNTYYYNLTPTAALTYQSFR